MPQLAGRGVTSSRLRLVCGRFPEPLAALPSCSTAIITSIMNSRRRTSIGTPRKSTSQSESNCSCGTLRSDSQWFCDDFGDERVQRKQLVRACYKLTVGALRVITNEPQP
ncbi:unnamed protein product, partial [Iphiclides podalirius]